MSRLNLTAIAEQIEKRLRRYTPGLALNYEDDMVDELREECDGLTGGELDCQPLDILTGMVAKRLRPKASA